MKPLLFLMSLFALLPPPRSWGQERATLPRRTLEIADSTTGSYVGAYDVDGMPGTIVSIYSLGRGQAEIQGDGWQALGWFTAGAFDGIWRRPGLGSDPNVAHEVGLLHLDAQPGAALSAMFRDADVRSAARREHWRLSARFGAPKFGSPHGATARRAARGRDARW
jgi:hypothetical protein